MAVMANTMAMTARERGAEYATLKALGFSNAFVALLILGESLGIALVGGVLGVLLTFPLAAAFADAMGSLFPIFFVSEETVLMQLGGGAHRRRRRRGAARVAHVAARIVDGLRAVA